MMHRKVYRVEKFADDSFEMSLRILIDYVLYNFTILDVEKIIYKDSTLSPDNVQIGDLKSMSKPKYIYATFNYLPGGSWTNIGGHEFCTVELKDGSKVLINWDISSNHETIIELDIKFARKLKLKKLNEKSNVTNCQKI